MHSIIVFGLPAGSADRADEVLLAETCRNASDVRRVQDAAAADGWHSFRVWTYHGGAPDFAGTVRALEI